jgi:hypothetical protein
MWDRSGLVGSKCKKPAASRDAKAKGVMVMRWQPNRQKRKLRQNAGLHPPTDRPTVDGSPDMGPRDDPARQRRRLADGSASSSTTQRPPAAVARDVALSPDDKTQVDEIQMGILRLFTYLEQPAESREPLTLTKHENESVAVAVDHQAGSTVIKRELTALAELTEQLADRYIAEVRKVYGECVHNGEQLVMLVREMFRKPPPERTSEESSRLRHLRDEFISDMGENSNGRSRAGRPTCARRRRKLRRAELAKIRAEVEACLANCRTRQAEYEAVMAAARARTHQRLRVALGSEDVSVWKQVYFELYYVAYGAFAKGRLMIDDEFFQHCSDDSSMKDHTFKDAPIVYQRIRKQSDGVCHNHGDKEDPRRSPDSFCSYGLITAAHCCLLMGKQASLDGQDYSSNGKPIAKELAKHPGMLPLIGRWWPNIVTKASCRSFLPLNHALCAAKGVGASRVEMHPGLTQISYRSPGRLHRKSKQPKDVRLLMRRVLLPVEVKQRAPSPFSDMPQPCLLLILTFVCSKELAKSEESAEQLADRLALWGAMSDRDLYTYSWRDLPAHCNAFVFMHKVLRRVSRQFRTLVDCAAVVSEAAAINLTRDPAHWKLGEDGYDPRTAAMVRSQSGAAGPLVLSDCLKRLGHARSLQLLDVHHGRDDGWSPAMTALRSLCDLRVLRIYQNPATTQYEQRLFGASSLSQCKDLGTAFIGLRQLVALDVDGVSIDIDMATTIAQHCKALRILKLGKREELPHADQQQLTALNLEAITSLKALRDVPLQSLTVRNYAGFADEILTSILTNSSTLSASLTQLQLHFGEVYWSATDVLNVGSITGTCLSAIIDSCPQLQILHIDPNVAYDDDVEESSRNSACMFPPDAVAKLCHLKDLRLVILAPPPGIRDWGLAADWYIRDAECYGRADYKNALKTCFMADNISAILQRVIQFSFEKTYSEVSLKSLLQPHEWMKFANDKTYDEVNLKALLHPSKITQSGVPPDLQALIRRLPRASRSRYRSKHPCTDVVDANGVGLLDFWAVAPLLADASLSRQEELQVLWVLSTYPTGNSDNEDYAVKFVKPYLLTTSAWTVKQLRTGAPQLIPALAHICRRAPEDENGVLATILADHLLECCLAVVEWVPQILQASLRPPCMHEDEPGIFCDDKPLAPDPKDPFELELLKEMTDELNSVAVIRPPDADTFGQVSLCHSVARKVQRDMLGRGSAGLCTRLFLEDLSAELTASRSKLHVNSRRNLFRVVLTACEDNIANPFAVAEASKLIPGLPAEFKVVRARNVMWGEPAEVETVTGPRTDRDSVLLQCFERCDSSHREDICGNPGFVHRVLSVVEASIFEGKFTQRAQKWLALLVSKGVPAGMKCLWISDLKKESYAGVQRQLAEEQRNVNKLILIATRFRAAVPCSKHGSVDEFPLFPFWYFWYNSTTNGYVRLRAKQAKQLLETVQARDESTYVFGLRSAVTWFFPGCADALVLAGLLVELPRALVHHADVSSVSRAWIMRSVSQWVEDFPIFNSIRADIDGYVGPAVPTYNSIRAKLGECTQEQLKQAYGVWSNRNVSDLELHSRGDGDDKEWIHSSVIPDSLLLTLAAGLIGKFHTVSEDGRTHREAEILVKRARCLSYHALPSQVVEAAFGAEWGPEQTAMRQHGDEHLWKSVPSMCMNLNLAKISVHL